MRIHILGASASGVTTLGKELSRKLDMAYFDSDDFYWEKTEIPYSIKIDPKVRDRVVLERLSGMDHWVLGGSIISWHQDIHQLFDLIVFLHIPQSIRLARLKARELNRYGHKIETDPFWKDKFDTFFAWARDYDEVKGIATRNIKTHQSWLGRQTADIVNLIGDLTVEEKIDRVMDRIAHK